MRSCRIILKENIPRLQDVDVYLVCALIISKVFFCGWYDFYWVKFLKIRLAGQLVAIFFPALLEAHGSGSATPHSAFGS